MHECSEVKVCTDESINRTTVSKKVFLQMECMMFWKALSLARQRFWAEFPDRNIFCFVFFWLEMMTAV